MVYYHLAKFGGHMYCGSKDILLLVCHVSKQEQIVKGSGDYKDKNPSG